MSGRWTVIPQNNLLTCPHFHLCGEICPLSQIILSWSPHCSSYSHQDEKKSHISSFIRPQSHAQDKWVMFGKETTHMCLSCQVCSISFDWVKMETTHPLYDMLCYDMLCPHYRSWSYIRRVNCFICLDDHIMGGLGGNSQYAASISFNITWKDPQQETCVVNISPAFSCRSSYLWALLTSAGATLGRGRARSLQMPSIYSDTVKGRGRTRAEHWAIVHWMWDTEWDLQQNKIR